MNQILITGEEYATEKVKVKKQKQVLPINVIVMFYAISIIILGICMVSGSVYARDQINKTVEASIKPEITVERNDEDNTIAINVTHIREILSVTYKWNDEEETTINGNNSKSVSETIKLIGGTNTLTVLATDESGMIQTLSKTFTAENIPEIEIVEAVDNGIKIHASSKEEIDYLQYSWDNEDMQKIEVGNKEYEGIINAPKGQHTLRIVVVDINGMTAELEQKVVGDTEPTVNVQSEVIDGKLTFVIDAEDDEGVVTISIIHNGGEKQTINVNAKTYHNEIVMTEGEENTIIVTATNINGITKTRRIKFKNM